MNKEKLLETIFELDIEGIRDIVEKKLWEAEVDIAYECEEMLIEKYGFNWHKLLEDEDDVEIDDPESNENNL